jgi:hypothetical protein
MKKWLKYNLQIFKTWFVYILLRKKLSNQAIELMVYNYNFIPRERKLFDRIKRINKYKEVTNETIHRTRIKWMG